MAANLSAWIVIGLLCFALGVAADWYWQRGTR
jgi:hypothetical protein